MTAGKKPSYKELEARLADAENALSAVRSGEVDAMLCNRAVYLVRLRELEQALRKSKEELEHRVKKRTEELGKKNIFLEREIKKNKIVLDQLDEERKKLINTCRQRDFLSRMLVDLLEKDRREISNALTDQIGQIMTGIRIQLENLGRMRTEDGNFLAARLGPVQELLGQTMDQIRNIALQLRPEILQRLGLLPAVKDFIDEIRQNHGYRIRFYTKGIPEDFRDGRKDLAIFRIIQESVHNIINHAKATEIHINLTQRNGIVTLTIEDDGIGFGYEDTSHEQDVGGKQRLGITIMRERAFMVGGDFRIDSSPGRGTCIQTEIPLFETDENHIKQKPHSNHLNTKRNNVG
jgi:signal transduction histidine kinase